MMRIFLDANVLFSAADDQSATSELLKEAAARAELVTSAYLLEEARRNLQIKRPNLLGGLDRVMQSVQLSAGYANVSSDLPEKDIPVICGAVGSRCTHIWTGDKQHFGRFFGKTLHGIKIVSAVGLLDELA